MGASLQTNKYVYYFLTKISSISMYMIHYCNIQEVGDICTNVFSSQFRIVISLFISIPILFYYLEVFNDFETIRKAGENLEK